MSKSYVSDDAPTLPWGMPVRRPPAESELPPLLRVEELAKLLRVDRKTVYDAIAKGEIPGARRLGRSIRVCRDAVLEWLRGQGGVSRSRR